LQQEPCKVPDSKYSTDLVQDLIANTYGLGEGKRGYAITLSQRFLLHCGIIYHFKSVCFNIDGTKGGGRAKEIYAAGLLTLIPNNRIAIKSTF
jgi:hypothetical protein